MLGIMGNIDQQVSDKADSMQMRGKTSTVSKDLLDVMATQKIAAEKDAALKQLQMAQQQNPATIKDQLEQKVMGMTQNEMTTQTAGILANKAQQRPQQQQQRPNPMGGLAAMGGGAPRPPMGGGAPRPPMGGAPRPNPMGGLAAMGGGAPRPMMASGGIVGYYDGATVVSDEKLKELGMTRETFKSLPKAAQARLAKPLSNQEAAQQRMAARQAELGKNIVARRADKEAEKKKMDEGLADNKQKQARAAAAAAGLQIAEPTVTSPAERTDTPLMGKKPEARPEFSFDPSSAGIAGAAPQVDPTATPAATGPKVDPMQAKLQDVNTQSSFDPTKVSGKRVSDAMGTPLMDNIKSAAGEDLYAKDGKVAQIEAAADTRYGVGDTPKELGGGIFAAMKAAQDPLKKEQERQISPEVQRAQRLLDARAGASGLGRRQAASSRAANEQRLEVKKDGVQQFTDRLNARLGAIAKSDEAGAKKIKNALDFKIAAMNSLSNISGQDAALLIKEADMMLRQDQQRITADLKKLEIMESSELRLQLAKVEDKQYMLNLLGKLAKLRADKQGEKAEQFEVELGRLDPVADRARIEQIQAVIKAYAAGIGSGQEKLIHQRLKELGMDVTLMEDPDEDELDFSTSALTDSTADADKLTAALNR